jgi:hypothetical protein
MGGGGKWVIGAMNPGRREAGSGKREAGSGKRELLAAGSCWLVADGCVLLPLASRCCYYPDEPFETGDGSQRQPADGGRQRADGRA